jgi:23S rRNA pseudouridine2605 synthase
MDEKIQKVLARAGYGSRREIETWIEAGRIKVNHQVAKLGDRIGPDDRIALDGKLLTRLHHAPQRRVIVYHKPIGEVCTRQDPQARPTIFQHLPRIQNSRWIAVGRLDINTVGLILLTTDGELANRLMHPSSQIEREYAVRVLGVATAEKLQQLQQGVMLEDGMAHFDRILDSGGEGSNHWFHVTLKEGRNREVRRLWEAVGLKVNRLIRIRYGNIELGRKLRPGKWRDLETGEIQLLLQHVGLAQQTKDDKVDRPQRKSHKGRRNKLSKH